MTRGVPLSVERVKEVLIAKDGNITMTANALGVARSTVHKRITESPALREIVDDAREGLVDIAESALKREVLAGNIAAIIFTLKTQGKHRGYVERQEVTGADGAPLKAYVSISPDDWDDDKGAE